MAGITIYEFEALVAMAPGAPDAGGSDEAVVITLSAKLSGTHESALAAAQAHAADLVGARIGFLQQRIQPRPPQLHRHVRGIKPRRHGLFLDLCSVISADGNYTTPYG